MILLSHVFDTSFGQIAVGMMRSGYTLTVPCTFNLFNGEKKVATVVAESIVMDNNSIVMTKNSVVDKDFTRISLQLRDLVDKSLVEERNDAYLIEAAS